MLVIGLGRVIVSWPHIGFSVLVSSPHIGNTYKGHFDRRVAAITSHSIQLPSINAADF